jgi:hypothetical protein
MRRLVDTAYGADADGNRGVTRVSYEIEASDEQTIKGQVQEYVSSLSEDEDPDDTVDVVLIDPVSEEDIYFTVRVKDYV